VLDDNIVGGKSQKQSRKKLADSGQGSDDRGDSASSKISRRSGDSGFDDEEEIQRQRESILLGRLLSVLAQNFSASVTYY